jgi:hypothetical protein
MPSVKVTIPTVSGSQIAICHWLIAAAERVTEHDALSSARQLLQIPDPIQREQALEGVLTSYKQILADARRVAECNLQIAAYLDHMNETLIESFQVPKGPSLNLN